MTTEHKRKSNQSRILVSVVGAVALATLASASATCSDDGRGGSSSEPRSKAAVARAVVRLGELRQRYETLRGFTPLVEAPSELRADGEGRLVGIFARDPDSLVGLPSSADGETSIVDRLTGVGARFSLEGAHATRPTVSGDLVIYPNALGTGDARTRSDLVMRLDSARVEDFVIFEDEPAKEELRYKLTPQGSNALRLFGGRLEVLDAHGAPRVRIEPPYVIDSSGARTEAKLDVEGCPVDRDPRAPWSRSLTELGGATTCTVVVSWSGVSYPALVDPEWKVSGFMLRERTHHTTTLLPSNELLIVGGYDVNGQGISDAEIMCPAETCPPAATFTATGSLASARGGQTETPISSGAQVLFTGGRATRASAGKLSSAEVYSIANGTFSSTGNMNNARAEHAATLLDASGGFKVLVTGGGGSLPTSTAELYDPVAGTFTATGNMVVQRHGHFAEILKSGKVLVGGGISTLNIAVSSAEVFDPATSAFTATTGSMTSQRAFATATRLEDAAGSVLVTGGTNGVGFYYKTADLFIPSGASGSFQQQPIIMQVPRAYHAATKLLGTGTVLVTGGFDGATLLDTAEVFDQATAQFVLGGSVMKHARAFHTATRLGSGQALVIGGGFDPLAGSVSFSTAISTETLERSNSETCNVNTECASGHCVKTANLGRICCDTECGGVCQACANDQTGQATGECHDVLDNTLVKPACDNAVQLKLLCFGGQVQAGNVLPCSPYACKGDKCGADTCTGPSDCSVDGWCSGNGCLVKQELATTCSKDEQCKGNHCVDGFCCDTKCDGQCEACDDSTHPGFCTQVTGKPHGGLHKACEGTDTSCEGSCGSKRDACDYLANACGASSCDAGVENSGTCSIDSPGVCVTGPKNCGTFACDPATQRCSTFCTTVADCAAGAVCVNGQCNMVETSACDGNHTVVSPDGSNQDCSPFRCNGPACINRCVTVDDCLTPNVCDDKGKCVTPPADPPKPSGCTVALATSGSEDTKEYGLLWMMGIGIGLLARRGTRGGAS